MADIPISRIIPLSPQAVKNLQQEIAAEIAQQVESDEDLSQYFELSVFNPLQQMQRFRKFEDLKSQLNHQLEEADGTEEKKILEVEKSDEAAARFQKNNDELNARTLRILKERIEKNKTAEDILKTVREVYADVALADEALDFLLETSPAKDAIQQAKKELNEAHGREIRAGRNMGAEARQFAKDGLGSPTSLRDLYRDITGNPREPLKLFDELAEKFQYEKLRVLISFLLHSLGQDLKAKGPSISRAELKRLLDETRSLQGILGIFRFFLSRMRLIKREFSSYNLSLPPRLDHELLSRILVKILSERYINPERILQFSKMLGISEELAAQLIIFSQMLDALKQIAPQYYRNPQHRQELVKGFIDALEKLEDELEEEDEEEK